jgi:hypothetical protein
MKVVWIAVALVLCGVAANARPIGVASKTGVQKRVGGYPATIPHRTITTPIRPAPAVAGMPWRTRWRLFQATQNRKPAFLRESRLPKKARR